MIREESHLSSLEGMHRKDLPKWPGVRRGHGQADDFRSFELLGEA